MQLPPTILSNDKKKSKSDSKSTKLALKKGPVPKDTAGSEDEDSSSDSSKTDDNDNPADQGLAQATSSLSLHSRPSIKLTPPRTLETTLFDRLEDMYGASIKRMLEVQYRSVSDRLRIPPR